jgi:valyl-tRNA synthetase
MTLPKRYKPSEIEPWLSRKWEQAGIYHFDHNSSAPVYSLDTPPATVSGRLHLGHTFSYSHPDFIARFWRMNGWNVFYPMGFDDNGLPTGRLVEKQLGLSASQIGREEFIKQCLKVSDHYGKEYQDLWRRLGLSIDWKFTYRTISPEAIRISQVSFLELIQNNLAYRKENPTIWCPECETAIAQAELEDVNRETDLVVIRFHVQKESNFDPDFLEIATTRPELLPACVAIFIHPEDQRYRNFVGRTAVVPIFHQKVPILADIKADPQKGTGCVMCCTFGDQTDISWWLMHNLPLVEILDQKGRLTSSANQFQGLGVQEAREEVKKSLREERSLLSCTPINQSIRVHERCNTPVEFVSTNQWFIHTLKLKQRLLEEGRKLNWVPPHMLSRFTSWVENLSWDWCISRQRFYGVPFPVWYCQMCGTTALASPDQLPVNPLETNPLNPCSNCGDDKFLAEKDVMDTWATSSLTPQIVGRWLTDSELYQKVFPFSTRPQAHEIIRTWTFYTILKSILHFKRLPWDTVQISGWGIAGEGMGKISKSRGGTSISPDEMITTYSADAIRYWAASTGPGKDAVISESKIKNGSRLVTKLWNVARFSAPFIAEFQPALSPKELSTGDRWILSKTQTTIERVTRDYQAFDYASAKTETENLFWIFADYYIEMSKQRLYQSTSDENGAVFTIHNVLLSIILLFAPIMPFITEMIFQSLFTKNGNDQDGRLLQSIHTSNWPSPKEEWMNHRVETFGEVLIEIASLVRRYKSEKAMPLNTELKSLQIALSDSSALDLLEGGVIDLKSITRAKEVWILATREPLPEAIYCTDNVQVALMS